MSTPDRTHVSIEALRDIAVESWRFVRLFTKLLSELDAGEQGRYQNQLRFFLRRLEGNLESAGLRVVNLEGHEFDPGMAATALNLEDFAEGDSLIVDQMIEPLIMGPSGVLHSGTVVLRKVTR
jgi:hypothetical protein